MLTAFVNLIYERFAMPLYEYKCPSCGFMNEILQKSSSEPAPVCPECGKGLEKQYSTFAAVVKTPQKNATKCHSCPNSGGCPSFQG